MRSLYRVTLPVLISLCCNGQTGAPLAIYTDVTPRCQNRPVTFRIADDSLLSGFTWNVSPSKGATIHGGTSGNIFTVSFETPTLFTVTAGASDTLQRHGQIVIGVSRSANASFNASLSAQGFPAELVLTNYSGSSQGIEWRFSDGVTDSLDQLIRPYSSGGSYSVQLVAFGQNGCNDTASYRFHIADSSGITLPNVFTPNGDGVNDVYRPIARGISQLIARVYNREQVLVHSWDKVNGFWDGRTTSGEACVDGVYILVVEATGFDGESYRLRGSVTLIR